MTGPDDRPGDGFVVGVDLGTSHTVAMVRWPDGRTRPILFDGQPLLPSAAYLDATGRLHVGRDALRLGFAEPGRFEPNPKRHIDDGTVLLGGAEVPVADLLAVLLGAVAREVVAATGFLPPAVLTHPAAWGEQRRAVLIEAISKAGWPRETRLVPEPVAAARYFADVLRRPVPVGSALAVFDFGGGTVDIAVVRNEGPGPGGWSRYVVAASGGIDDLGGLDLDAALVDHLGKTLAGAEPQAWQALTEPVTLAQWRARRQFWEDVRGAKEMLSRSAFAPVPVPGVEHAVHLTRDELEATTGPLVRRAVTEAATVISAAGLTPHELAGLFLVGGSSRVPLVSRLLHSELGIAPTVLEQPELPVAEGAVLAAFSPPAGGWPGAPDQSAPVGSGGRGSGAAADGSDLGGPVAGRSAAGPGPATADLPVTEAEGPGADRAPTDAGVAPAGGSATDRPGAASGGVTSDLPASVPLTAHPPVADTWPRGGTPAIVPSADPVSRGPGSPTGPAGGASASGASAGGVSAGGVSAAGPLPAPPALSRISPVAATGGVPQGEAEPEYAEPVDPWATGEAAAFARPPAAEPWLASTQPDPSGGIGGGAAASGGRGRAYKKWLIGALAVVLLGVAATVTFVLWPKYPALGFHPLGEVRTVTPAVALGSGFAAVAVRGDRAYFANVDAGYEKDEKLGVVAADAATGEQVWANGNVGEAIRWEQFLATPQAVVAISARDYTKDNRLMVLLNPADGKVLWQRFIGGADNVFFVGDVVVQVDQVGKRVVGLEVQNQGRERWSIRNPTSKYNLSTAAVIRVTTGDDHAGPAATSGATFAQPGDDHRIVLVGADRSAQVIDAGTGKLGRKLENVADPDDEVIAHNGRLIVAESDTLRRIISYDLVKSGQPTVLYNPADPNVRLEYLTECGADRVCFLSTVDATKAEVMAVDAAAGGLIWHRPLTGVDNLVPVGESVLAVSGSPTPRVSLLDPEGAVTWTKPGEVARLDAANLLLFAKPLSSYATQPSLSGQHLGDKPVLLGPLSDQRPSTCAWNASVIACAADKDFKIQEFAS